MGLNFNSVFARSDYLMAGLQVTVLIALGAIVISFIVGTAVAICRISRFRALRIFASLYIDVFRNTPFLIQLYFLYYGLPDLGIPTEPVTTGVIALGLTGAAGNAEIIRSGIETVNKSVVDAARSFALTSSQVYRLIVLPIALRISWRPLGNAFVNLVLTTSIVSTITVNDLTGNASNISAENFKPFEVFLVVLVIYCAVTFAVSGIVNAIYALFFARTVERPLIRGQR